MIWTIWKVWNGMNSMNRTWSHLFSWTSSAGTLNRHNWHLDVSFLDSILRFKFSQVNWLEIVENGVRLKPQQKPGKRLLERQWGALSSTLHLFFVILAVSFMEMCQGLSQLLILGMGDLPHLIVNPYNGYMNLYYWVYDRPLRQGKNGHLDPSKYQLESLHRQSCQIRLTAVMFAVNWRLPTTSDVTQQAIGHKR